MSHEPPDPFVDDLRAGVEAANARAEKADVTASTWIAHGEKMEAERDEAKQLVLDEAAKNGEAMALVMRERDEARAECDAIEGMYRVEQTTCDRLRILAEQAEATRLTSVDAVVHYRNLAIALGAKPDEMVNAFDRGLCSTWDASAEGGKREHYDEVELWRECEKAEAQVAAMRTRVDVLQAVLNLASMSVPDIFDVATKEQAKRRHLEARAARLVEAGDKMALLLDALPGGSASVARAAWAEVRKP